MNIWDPDPQAQGLRSHPVRLRPRDLGPGDAYDPTATLERVQRQIEDILPFARADAALIETPVESPNHWLVRATLGDKLAINAFVTRIPEFPPRPGTESSHCDTLTMLLLQSPRGEDEQSQKLLTTSWDDVQDQTAASTADQTKAWLCLARMHYEATTHRDLEPGSPIHLGGHWFTKASPKHEPTKLILGKPTTYIPAYTPAYPDPPDQAWAIIRDDDDESPWLHLHQDDQKPPHGDVVVGPEVESVFLGQV